MEGESQVATPSTSQSTSHSNVTVRKKRKLADADSESQDTVAQALGNEPYWKQAISAINTAEDDCDEFIKMVAGQLRNFKKVAPPLYRAAKDKIWHILSSTENEIASLTEILTFETVQVEALSTPQLSQMHIYHQDAQQVSTLPTSQVDMFQDSQQPPF